MSALGLLPPPSAAATLFRTGGDFYITLPKLLFHELRDLLPKDELAAAVNAAIKVMAFLVEMAWQDRLDPLLTDRVIAAELGISPRSVQRGLWALDVVLGQIGMPIIKRLRAHGRRIISFVRGFAARGQAAPPCPPLPKTKDTTTTRESSSSLDSIPEKSQEPRVTVPQGLIDRALRLILRATAGRVIDAVAVYGLDWVKRALDVVERRNKKPGNLPVKSWGFFLRILENWKKEGGPTPDDPPPAPPPVCATTPPAQEEPPQRLTAEEVAELVRRCQSRNPSDVPTAARFQLRAALAEGGIPPELVATIPADLLSPPKPRSP